ncbi:MAG: ATP-binding protein [Pseudonocardia sp.]
MASGGFVGRRAALTELAARLSLAARSGGDFVLLRGRRQVGKSRLVTEFLARSGCRSVYFQAARRPASDELASFTEAIARSNLVGAEHVRSGLRFASWESAFEWVATSATTDDPVVIVLDELPYLTATDPAFESVVQRVWDHILAGQPVLLIVVGSDLATMEALSSYDRPLYGRVRLDRSVEPLSPAEVALALDLPPVDAMDAYLTIGGFPRLLLSWPPGMSRAEFLGRELTDPTSALVVIGERMLAAEFPAPETARAVLDAVGHGERTFGTLGDRSGLGATSLQRALVLLRTKRVVVAEEPLSRARGGRSTRYRVSDPYLRFWLRFVGPALPDIERGRADLAIARVADGWTSYRGRAVEPLVREALERLAPLEGLEQARDFGAYWTRGNETEVDLVGVADRKRVQRVAAIGSVKWRDRGAFGEADEAELRRGAAAVPGADEHTGLLAVSAAGFATGPTQLVRLGPEILMTAWSS